MARIGRISVADDVLERLINKSEANRVAKLSKVKKTVTRSIVVTNNTSMNDTIQPTFSNKRKQITNGKKTKKQTQDELRSSDDDLCWVDELILRDRDILTAVAAGTNKGMLSPHKSRIVGIALNRSSYSGRVREHFIQVRLFYYLETHHPEFYMDAYAIPNGGIRPAKTGWDLVAEGVKTGHPDINIDCPRGKYFGLRLEVKSSIGSASLVQEEKIKHLNKRGYFAVVGYGYAGCKKIIDDYLKLGASQFKW